MTPQQQPNIRRVYRNQQPQRLKVKRRLKKRAFLYLAFWVVLVVAFGRLAAVQATRYNELRAEITRMQAETAHESRIAEELRQRLAFIGTPAYIEQMARERLGLVRPNEILFVNTAN